MTARPSGSARLVDVQCCFCGHDVRDGLTALVAAASRVDSADAPSQQLWFHADCLGARLAPDVPFDGDVFFD